MSAVWPTALLGRLSPFGRASADGRYLLVRLGPQAVSPLVLLSPVTAVLLGWLVADETFTSAQVLGIALVLVSVWASQRIRATAASAKRDEAPGEPVVRAP
jgi:probable blue pigment (indigoidine) exporter